MQPTPTPMPEFKLTDAQYKVLSCLLTGHSISDAARAAGVHRNTVTNWRHSVPNFSTFLDQALTKRALNFREQAEALQGKALRLLRETIEDPTASHSVRVRAALGVFKINVATPAIQQNVQLQVPVEEPTEPAQPAQSAAQEIEIPHKPAQQPIRVAPQPGRNSQCTCGSGLKFKRCCANNVAPQAANGIAA